MNKRSRGAPAVGLMLFALTTSADPDITYNMFRTGNQLLADCDVESGPPLMACAGYMMGFSDLASHVKIVPIAARCIPAGSTADQLRRIVVKFLKDHPEELHFTGASLTDYALSQAFPCPAE